ncbi:GCN5-related N-acetyltransferase [Xylanimonas cellulosilytica DSM 15894]|uniref:GCN5-related N-acetyltransferase n=1 Tax=Xylanimonas cellulosilytica (strain DSM 15894 / JCM 12276 / CECT 5975 / KCTC 9989 / LMG 20990 / NBRC 107835 / XIL07) TaxID=446471 RepID=D1BSA5_XYLCX|nr:GNAT family N-acetyltransferase [Xylanimonas cellulosilytica]ACZ30597.1 GCN5-related N-acetyltransferase [Xylanimonas cellulosilytica DSM 15894]
MTVPLPDDDDGAGVVVRTARLTLRRVRPADAEAFLTWRSQPPVMRYLYLEPWTPEVARERLTAWATDPFAGPGDVLELAVEADGAVVGEALLKWKDQQQTEIGYAFHPTVVGRGYATEATRALLALAFDTYGFHRAYASIDAENLASVRVAQRLGMRHEATLVENAVRPADGVWGTEVVYAMLASEHAARRRP